jgi:predicted membrane channel-forming protein YqfA (hemolysin III family)
MPQINPKTQCPIWVEIKNAACNILSTKHTEFWNIWTSIIPLTVHIHLMIINVASQHSLQNRFMLAGVFCACIFSQLCSAVYHIFHSVSPQALFNLDLAGVCCMSFGSPWLYVNAYGTDGLGIYMLALFSLMIVCIFKLAKASLRNEIAACEPWILALASVGNYPALNRPVTTISTATIFIAYLLFYRLHFPERFLQPGTADGKIWSSHVLWHIAVFIGQLGYISTILN